MKKFEMPEIDRVVLAAEATNVTDVTPDSTVDGDL